MKHLAALLLSLPLLAACTDPAPVADSGLSAGLYAGKARDRLCVGKGAGRSGLIVYGTGDTNCSATGRIVGDAAAGTLALVPAGEKDGGCRIPLTLDGDKVTVGDVPATCAYYCGPGAALAGQGFTRDPAASPAVDFGGDPLC